MAVAAEREKLASIEQSRAALVDAVDRILREDLAEAGLGAAAAKVALRELVDVNRGDVQPGFLPLPAPAVAKREAIEEVLRVRVRAHLRAEKRNPLARCGRLA